MNETQKEYIVTLTDSQYETQKLLLKTIGIDINNVYRRIPSPSEREIKEIQKDIASIPKCKECHELVWCDGDCCFDSYKEQREDFFKQYGTAIHNATQKRMIGIIKKTDVGACPHNRCRRGEGHDNLNCRDCLIVWIEESLRKEQPFIMRSKDD